MKPYFVRHAKRTHAANHMRRVQRVNDSLAQSGAAAVRIPHFTPSVLPAITPRMRNHCARGTRSACGVHDGHYGSRRMDIPSVQDLSFPPQEAIRSSPELLRDLRRRLVGELRRDRPQETVNSKVNQTNPITVRPLRMHDRQSRPARNRNGAFRKPSCLARASNSRRDPNAKHRVLPTRAPQTAPMLSENSIFAIIARSI